jgi:hypothetical protein
LEAVLRKNTFIRSGACAVALFILIGTQSAMANTIIDLTTAGAQSTQNAVIGGSFTVQQIQPQSTGTGFIDSFVRIQQTGSERGYNTSNGTPLDDKAGTFTHALLLSDIGTDPTNTYYRFVLDINQVKTTNLSLNQIQIFQSNGDPTGYSGLIEASSPPSSASLISFSNATEVFRMNNTSTPTAYEIQLNYDLNSGSGSGDMNLFVLKSAFNGANGSNVILYSQFGSPNGSYESNDGFEEWWNLRATACTDPLTCNPNSVTPEPSSVVLLGSGLLGLALAARKRARKTGN